jgi:hypothetical protein
MSSIAQLKLNHLVAESSAAAVARLVGCTGNTIRLLVAGCRPKATTVEKLQAVGIEPLDWFTPIAREVGR